MFHSIAYYGYNREITFNVYFIDLFTSDLMLKFFLDSQFCLSCGMAFDGGNIWVADYTGGVITKLRASDGVALDIIPLGTLPYWAAFDGANVWVTVRGDNAVTKIRASDDTVLGNFTSD